MICFVVELIWLSTTKYGASSLIEMSDIKLNAFEYGEIPPIKTVPQSLLCVTRKKEHRTV